MLVRFLKIHCGPVFLVVVCVACATSDFRPELVRTDDPVRDGRNAIVNGPVEDRVLWQNRTGLELIRRDQLESAAPFFDDSLALIGSRYGTDRSAKNSRGYFSDESNKTFIGEPYERAMAYYYRGLIYWQQGQIDNARACFRSAQIEDSDAEGQEFAGDYVLMDYLDGLASHRLNGSGWDAYQRATNSATLVVPERFEGVGNVLFFVEYGNAPEKYAAGEYREKLKFRDGGSSAIEVVIRAGKQAIHLGAMDDLSYQATTRGGRVMDHILANQAVFKRTTDTLGDAALMSGLILAQNRKTQEAGLGIAAVGLVSKMFSAATTPRADTRAWDNLPKFLTFGSMQLAPGRYDVEVEFLNDGREIIAALGQRFQIDVNAASADTVIIVSQFKTKDPRL